MKKIFTTVYLKRWNGIIYPKRYQHRKVTVFQYILERYYKNDLKVYLEYDGLYATGWQVTQIREFCENEETGEKRRVIKYSV